MATTRNQQGRSVGMMRMPIEMPIEELIQELDTIPTYGYSNKKLAAIKMAN